MILSLPKTNLIIMLEDFNKLWWISQPEAHSFYLLRTEYIKIQEWLASEDQMQEEVLIYGVDILGKHHPTHAICRMFSEEKDNLGDLSHPIFEEFKYLKDIRTELKNFTHERKN